MSHWHVAHVQDSIKGIAVERVTFTEVTKKAVQEALQNPRQISDNLVESYKARRALDFLVGFGISPILWSKMVGSKSAGKEGTLSIGHSHPALLANANTHDGSVRCCMYSACLVRHIVRHIVNTLWQC